MQGFQKTFASPRSGMVQIRFSQPKVEMRQIPIKAQLQTIAILRKASTCQWYATIWKLSAHRALRVPIHRPFLSLDLPDLDLLSARFRPLAKTILKLRLFEKKNIWILRGKSRFLLLKTWWARKDRRAVNSSQEAKSLIIAYVKRGTSSIEIAKVFYSSFFLLLSCALSKENCGDLSYWLPWSSLIIHPFPDAYFKVPYNGWPASSGNGQMIVFETQSQSKVLRLRSTAINMAAPYRVTLAFVLHTAHISVGGICGHRRQQSNSFLK